MCQLIPKRVNGRDHFPFSEIVLSQARRSPKLNLLIESESRFLQVLAVEDVLLQDSIQCLFDQEMALEQDVDGFVDLRHFSAESFD